MNFVVGMLLCMNLNESENQRDDEKPDISKIEEDVFWTLVYIMQKKEWRNLYTKNTPKLQDLLQHFDDQVKKSLPRVHHVITECVIRFYSQF